MNNGAMHDSIALLSTIPPVLERYELKYVIPGSLIEPISDFLTPYCVLDSHSEGQEGGFYPVNSLYLDSPGFRFLKLRMGGADRRFNMRVRSYGDGCEGPYFAEIKYRTPNSISKYRSAVQTSDWPRFLLTNQVGSGVCSAKEQMSQDLFLRLAESYAIEPKIFTCYKRRAFLSVIDDYARVTFDINLRYRVQSPARCSLPFLLSPGPDCLNYDTHDTFGDEPWHTDDVVLELKTTAGIVPIWMMELIRRFELKRVGFSKYMNSSLMSRYDDGTLYMPFDRASAGVA